MGLPGRWNYMKLKTYTTRLYCRALSEDEVLNNYVTSVGYHQFLEKLYE